MAVTAQMVKELRGKTGAGMMDCKKALVECEENMEAAVDWLREKGIAKAAKKAGRIAAEGLCSIIIEGNEAIIFELNSETDFVAKNEHFLNLIHLLEKALIQIKPQNIEEALKGNYNGSTIEQIIIENSATIGEKITLRRVELVTKNDQEIFGAYKHMGGRIAVLTVIEGNDAQVSKDIAMHIAASNPKYLDKSSVKEQDLNHEREMFAKELQNELANETNEKAKEAKSKRIPQIVEGKINKWLKESCLVNQPFVKNTDITVLNYLNNSNSKLTSFIRFEVGEGIEKREDNFKDEVMAQVRA